MSVLTPHRVRRLDDGRIEHYFPDANSDGFYELSAPSIGSEAHHKKNTILVASIELALHLVREHGLSIRMNGNLTSQRNLISASQIECL
ncbi:hypothetical protein [Sphingomonas bacterium]|uniref:hypothetical protein n=1 Tax=Sphingomonas bacterium TaxID=1895847 RepID=UPI0015771DBB|nr:hypothetical protein [Sphingomonas bacterium]